MVPGIRIRAWLAGLLLGLTAATDLARSDEQAQLEELLNQFNALVAAGRFDQAEAAGRQLVEFTDRAYAQNAPVRFTATVAVVAMYDLQDRLVEAEPMMRRARALAEQLNHLAPDELPTIVDGLNLLAGSFDKHQRHLEEGRLRKRAVQLVEQTAGPASAQLLQPLVWLGLSAGRAMRHAEAEHYWRKAVEIGDQAGTTSNPYFTMALSFLSTSLNRQNRLQEAESFARRSVAASQQQGAAATTLPGALGMLAGILEQQQRFAEAETLRQRALRATMDMKLMLKEQFVAWEKVNLAALYRKQGRLDESERWLVAAMNDLAKVAAKEGDRALTLPLEELARLEEDRGDLPAALAAVERLIVASDDPGYHLYARRARLRWKMNDRPAALADLERALALAEQARMAGGGGEHDRAELFSQFAADFETMMTWRHEQRDLPQAFAVAERFRARSMIDQLALQGADPLAGLPAEEAARLRDQTNQARASVAALERQVLLAQAGNAGPALAQARSKLAEARQALIEAHREARNASAAYKLAVRADFSPAPMTAVEANLERANELLLGYTLGRERSYVVAVSGAAHPAVMTELVVDEAEARLLGLEPGPLTVERCRAILLGVPGGRRLLAEASRGLDLENDGAAMTGAEVLAALWRVLVPAAQRDALLNGQFAGLVIIPDGALSMLPFEMLVVGQDDQGAPRYLLDAGPPVRYGPSATVLANLAARGAAPLNSATHDVLLTVADPAYQGQSSPAEESPLTGPFEVAARFRSAGRNWKQLPGSAAEAARVERAFRDQGLRVGQIMGEQATEARVRQAVAGKRVVHVACHGVSDSTHGNLFGALALTPGKEATGNPADDGYLTLAEIYELPLTHCELAILSACETNYGPFVSGEGTWGLSRGFLVAGARRVLASNWLVDDQAAAALMGSFAESIAEELGANRPARYAAALQQAKRQIRAHKRWSAPYYWAAFVLIGPD